MSRFSSLSVSAEANHMKRCIRPPFSTSLRSASALARNVRSLVGSRALTSSASNRLITFSSSSSLTSLSTPSPSSASRPFHSSFLSSAASSSPSSSLPPGYINFNLADIGEGISECEVLQWFVKVGDSIHQFDKVCLVASDKASVEITSRYDGIVKELKYEVGSMAKVGSPLIVLQQEGAAAAASASSSTSSVPSAGVNAPRDAFSTPSAAIASSSNGAVNGNHLILTSPAVRRIAKEENVDLALVHPTGPGGRILKDDVIKYIASGGQNAARAAAPPSKPAVTSASSTSPAKPSSAPSPSSAPVSFAPTAGYLSSDAVVPITGLNKVMVQTMTAAAAVPHLGFSDELNMDDLHRLREQLKPIALKQGVKLTYMPFIIKSVSLALRSFPQLNAHTNFDCSAVTHRASHNIGIAMDTPRGLLVPNIKNVQQLSIMEIAKELQRLAEAGKAGRIGKEDLTGGTFTISNVGNIGGTYLSPILVLPEVIIGAIGGIQVLPRFDAEMNVKATRVMRVSWSADHRVLDGATVARFSVAWKQIMEKPELMLLETR